MKSQSIKVELQFIVYQKGKSSHLQVSFRKNFDRSILNLVTTLNSIASRLITLIILRVTWFSMESLITLKIWIGCDSRSNGAADDLHHKGRR